MSASILIPAVFAFVWLLFWTIAGVMLARIRKDAKVGVRVVGEVTGFGDFSNNGRIMYVAHYQAVVDGRTVTGASSTGRSWKSPAVGTRVPLYYRADDAEEPLHAGGAGRYLLPAILIAVGTPFAMIAVAGAIAI